MKRQIAMAIILATSIGAAAPELPVSYRDPPHLPAFDGRLSVMTYNIHGLPWPVAWGRTSAFVQIAQRLGALRAQGRQPHVVLLQEAFTQQAQSIGRAAGYRYVVEDHRRTWSAPRPPMRRMCAIWRLDHGRGGRGWANMSAADLKSCPTFPSWACAGWSFRPSPALAMIVSPTRAP